MTSWHAVSWRVLFDKQHDEKGQGNGWPEREGAWCGAVSSVALSVAASLAAEALSKVLNASESKAKETRKKHAFEARQKSKIQACKAIKLHVSHAQGFFARESFY